MALIALSAAWNPWKKGNAVLQGSMNYTTPQEIQMANERIAKILPYAEFNFQMRDAETPRQDIMEVEHLIIKGDTLGEIAKKYGTTVDEIIAWNPDCGGEFNLKVDYELKFPVSSKKDLEGLMVPNSEYAIKQNEQELAKKTSEEIARIEEEKGLEFIAHSVGRERGKTPTDLNEIKTNLQNLIPHVKKSAPKYKKVDVENLMAMGFVESKFDPFAIAKDSTAMGVWQFTKANRAYDYEHNASDVSKHTDKAMKKYSDINLELNGSNKLTIISMYTGEGYAKKVVRALARENNIRGKNTSTLMKKLRGKGIGVNQILAKYKKMDWTPYQREKAFQGLEYLQEVQRAKKTLKEDFNLNDYLI